MNMKINGIIAEYHPFHNGHRYQLLDAKEALGADYTVVLMSGNFVQRGTLSMFDKHIRTQMALRGGADLVLELPVSISTGSAEYFATGAVTLLNGLGCIDHLCFGSESGQLHTLSEAVNILTEEPHAYREALRKELSLGASFPKARQLALLTCLPHSAKSSLQDGPNDILAMEYLKALKLTKSSMLPYTTGRKGSGYHETDICEEFASATGIRNYFSGGQASMEIPANQIPSESFAVLSDYLKQNRPLEPDAVSSMLYYQLRSLSETGYTDYLDVSEDLSNRIRKLLPSYQGFTQFCGLLKTKDLTYSRVSRSLIHILLGIRQYSVKDDSAFPGYVRVLGFRKSAAPLLSALGKQSSVTLLSKPADAGTVLSAKDFSCFEKQMFADAIYEQLLSAASGRPPRNEYTISPRITE